RVNAVRGLSDWLVEESTARGVFPDPGPNWTNNHNCYAFAMNCGNPQGAGYNSRPGKYANQPAAYRNQFTLRLASGGTGQGAAVPGGRQGGLPTPVPPPAAAGFLVAMVANDMGYHFLRRVEATGLWMHKNGANSDVENHFYDTTIEQPVPI